jgi:hypothetical protein
MRSYLQPPTRQLTAEHILAKDNGLDPYYYLMAILNWPKKKKNYTVTGTYELDDIYVPPSLTAIPHE